MHITIDPQMSEWGNPVAEGGTTQQWGRTRELKHLSSREEKKTIVISQSSGERNGKAQTKSV